MQYLETPHGKETYDYSIDIMSHQWNGKKALDKFQQNQTSEIGDLLLDQTIFAGVGNIIKNESLYLMKKAPNQLIG